jgi:predicted transcriptional regulator
LRLSEIKEILKAEVIAGEEHLSRTVAAGVGSDLMSDLLTGPTSEALLLTGLNNIQVIRTAVIAGINGVVLVRGKRPGPDMILHAREHQLPLMTTPFTMFSACGRLFHKGLRGVEKKPVEAVDIKKKLGR